MYSPALLDHFQHPRHAGELPDPAVVVEVRNPACGDILKLSVRMENQTVRDAAFKAAGCVPAIACGSWLAEWIHGKNAADLSQLRAEHIASSLGDLPSASWHAAELACDAVRKLIERLR